MIHKTGFALLADLDNDGNFESVRTIYDDEQILNGTFIDLWVKREFFDEYDWVHVSDICVELSRGGIRIRAEIDTDSNPDKFNIIVCLVSSDIDA